MMSVRTRAALNIALLKNYITETITAYSAKSGNIVLRVRALYHILVSYAAVKV